MNTRNPGRLLYATIFVLAAIEYLQAGMTAFAALPIMGETSLSPEDFSLIAAVYASAAILSISMQRWFVERLGGRRYLQGAAAISVLGSVLCATSTDFNGFLAGRVVMALGGGAFFTSGRMIIHHLLAGRERFTGIRYLASGLAISTALAPWLASVAVADETWTAIYWLLAGLGVVAFVLAGVTLPAGPIIAADGGSHWTLWQQALLAGGSFLLLYSLQRFYYDFYGNSALLALTAGASLLGLLIYFRLQQQSAQPLLRVSAMLRPRYLAGLALFGFAYVMLGANNYVIPVMLQRTLGYGWATVGHFEALGLSVAVLTWIIMARLLPRYPAPRKFMAAGFLALAIFGGLLTQITSAANLWFDILPALAFNSIFLLTVLPTTAMQTFRELDQDESVFANAQQLKNMMAQAGIALGISLATIGQQWRTAVHYSALDANVSADNPLYAATVAQIQQTLALSMAPAQAAQVATANVAQLLAQQAAMLANIDHFALVAILGVLGILVTGVQRVLR